MEQNKSRVKNATKLGDHQVNFIENQNNCALCGTQLDISVSSYLENYTLREEAKCPKCNLKTRVKDHKMQ